MRRDAGKRVGKTVDAWKDQFKKQFNVIVRLTILLPLLLTNLPVSIEKVRLIEFDEYFDVLFKVVVE